MSDIHTRYNFGSTGEVENRTTVIEKEVSSLVSSPKLSETQEIDKLREWKNYIQFFQF